MKHLLPVLVIIVFFTNETNAPRAETSHTGNELYTICFDAIDIAKQSYCLGFIMGVTDALASLKHHCIPEGVKGDQIRDLVLSFLHRHVEIRSSPAHILIANRLATIYPCKN